MQTLKSSKTRQDKRRPIIVQRRREGEESEREREREHESVVFSNITSKLNVN